MTLCVTVYDEFAATDTPEPFAAVFHPVNVWPVRVGNDDDVVMVVL